MERSIAVAIDKDKTSQYALKWAIEHVVPRDQTVKLVHVKDKPMIEQNDGTMTEHQTDNHGTDLFLPFRCYCRRRRVECDSVILEETDVAKALIAYICQYGVETLLLGAGSRTGLSRLFKTADIPGNVLKWAPDFCTIYIISKGKISAMRNATRPIPSISIAGATINAQRNLPPDQSSSLIGNESWFDEFSAPEAEFSIYNPERMSTDSTLFDFYENLGSQVSNQAPSRYSDMEPMTPLTSDSPPEIMAGSPTSFSLQHEENLVDEVRKLKTELKQTMDMFHAACKEVFIAKQKVKELEEWKINVERRLHEEHKTEEKESPKYTNSNGARKSFQKLLEMEVQKRVNAEMKAPREGDEKKVINGLGVSPMAIKYQILFHITIILLSFYFYWSVLG